MPDIQIAHHALGAFYGAAFAIVVAEDLYAKVQDVIPEALDVFTLSPAGKISMPAESGSAATGAKATSPIGMPAGLKAILVTAATEKAGHALIDLCKQHKLYNLPVVESFKGFSFFGGKRAVQTFLGEVVAKELLSDRHHLSEVSHQLATLRGRYERLWLGYDMARRMIRGVGYDTRFICFRLPPGNSLIEGTSDQGIKIFSQFLPVDLAGLAGINLYVPEQVENASSGTEACGELTARIIRSADRSVIGEVTVPYSDIGAGWNSFMFDRVVSQVHGDGQLELQWNGNNGPCFACADIEAEKFGTENRRTLAMEVLRGLAEPSLDQRGRYIEDLAPNSYALSPRLLAQCATFLHGEDALENARELLQGEVVSVDPSSNWLQTHLLPEQPTAVRLRKLRLEDVQGVSVKFEMGHRLAPPAIFVLMLVPKTLPDQEAAKVLENICEKAGSAGEMAEVPAGVLWNAAICTANQAGRMALPFQETAKEGCDILLAVSSHAEEYKFGHARWTSVELLVAPEHGVMGPDANIDEAGRCALQQISSFRMSELSQHIGYIDGPEVLAEITQRLGFSPLSFNEETGAMQTHPFDGGPSASVYYGGIPASATRVSVDVVSAHEVSPVFTYILAAIPSAAGDKQGMVKHIVAQVREGQLLGKDMEQGVTWVAAAIPALQKRRLDLELHGSNETSDAVFIAIGLDGSDAYGWCRWYNLSIASSTSATSVHSLSRPGVASSAPSIEATNASADEA